MIANPGASCETYSPRGQVPLKGDGGGVVFGVEGVGSALVEREDDVADEEDARDIVLIVRRGRWRGGEEPGSFLIVCLRGDETSRSETTSTSESESTMMGREACFL